MYILYLIILGISTANVICPIPPQNRRKAESFHTCVLSREVSFPYLCIQPVQYVKPSIHTSWVHPAHFLRWLSSASSSQLRWFLQRKTCDISKRHYLKAVMDHELSITNQGWDLNAINSSTEKKKCTWYSARAKKINSKPSVSYYLERKRVKGPSSYKSMVSLGYFEQSWPFLL